MTPYNKWFALVAAYFVFVFVGTVIAYNYTSRPVTCEMGKMTLCPGGRGVQFCQHDHWTGCYRMELTHQMPKDWPFNP